MKKKGLFLSFIILILLLISWGLTACGTTGPNPGQDQLPQGEIVTQEGGASEEFTQDEGVQDAISEGENTPAEPEPTAVELPSFTATPEPIPLPPTPTGEPVSNPLPPEPQEIQFQAEDGTLLQGRYYPADVNPAPMIVLMHWAVGDQSDWVEVAFWLQNRGLSGTSPDAGSEPWLDPTWFPPMMEASSFGVFTFTFRECQAGCSNFSGNRPLWLIDAKAAMQAAMELEGVDPMKLVALGASIGADGATDGCYLHNTRFENSCLGALSLSPGDYLTIPYSDAVDNLMAETPPKPDWCLFATGDGEAFKACNAASGQQYLSIEWSGNHHGMMLIQPDVEPNVLLKILNFLTLVFKR
jgi:predicted small lipoprotein YifL